MALKIVGPKAPERDDMPQMPAKYRGYEGQGRFAEDTYVASECDGVVALVVGQGRLRLARGDDQAEVQEWLAGQIAQAAEDEAARARWGRTAKVTLSENPTATRAACAASLARAVVHEFNNRRR